MLKYSLIDDGQGNYRHGYESYEEQEMFPEPDQKSMVRLLLRDAELMTLRS